MWIRPISISLSPNTEKDDILLAFRLSGYKRGKAVKQLEEQFKQYLGVRHAFAFNSGRTCLMAILDSLKIQGEVLLQAFTCNAAVNPIIWSGLKPVYVDCDENTFNMDMEDLARKITLNSKAVIIQHTFGIPGEIPRENLVLIEDCAHSLGAEINGQKIGTFGKAAFFSFSRDKIISSVYGGVVVTNDDDLAERIKNYQDNLKYPSYFWIFQQLLHPILMNLLILPTYRILGKYLLILFQWLKVLSKAVHWKEKQGLRPGYFPRKMPNALAVLALNQFKKLEKLNNHRRELARFYYDNLALEFPEINGKPVFLRVPIKHKDAHKIIKKAWKNNLLIGDWYTSPVAPDDTDLRKVQYVMGSCPKAEKLAKTTFNLPTNISLKEAEQVIKFLK